METLIFFKTIETPIGTIKVESSKVEILSVSFIDNVEVNSENQPAVLDKCAKQLIEYFEGSRKQFSVAIKAEGTQFQKSVWGKLEEIPFGKTENYLGLSRQLQNPGAVRAVGTANGKNPLLIIVPCHRIVGSKGELTGYSAGLYRKQWLIEHESKVMGTHLLLF